MAKRIVSIPHKFRLAGEISFRKDYSPPSSPPSRPYRTSSRPSGPPMRVEPAYRRGGVRGRHVSREHGRESSAGRLAHPSHSMRMVEACSAAAARGAAFVRPHCRPHITEVHSAAASAQSPSAALNGYDGTTPFHYTAYAASYTARSATRQATASYAASYALALF